MNLHERIEEGLLTRGAWTDTDAEGRERVCLLVHFSAEVGESKNPSDCPADVMPAWLAHLMPSIDDNGSEAAWPAMVRRFADVADRWHVLSDDDWEDARRAFLVAVLDDVKELATSKGTLHTIELVRQWLVDGEPEDRKAEVRRDAAAYDATDAYDDAVAYAADRATSCAVSSATYAARVASCTADASASASASAAAWDRMTDALLSDLERRCDHCEKEIPNYRPPSDPLGDYQQTSPFARFLRGTDSPDRGEE